ncbi:hypothetical protein ACA910_002625 [Epithemia clementina (nom. ined.)]
MAASLVRRSSSLWKFNYSIDVLTDGSEYTGNGTLFLSVYRSRYNHHANRRACGGSSSSSSSTTTDKNESSRKICTPLVPVDDDDDDGTKDDADNNNNNNVTPEDAVPLGEVVARYALSGVGDCTSRLAADQRYKLKTVRAAFCSSKNHNNNNNKEDRDHHHHHHHELMGIASLLFALRQAGAPSLSLVTPSSRSSSNNGDQTTTTFVEDMVQFLVERNFSKHPKVLLCQVPSPKSPSTTTTTSESDNQNDKNVVVDDDDDNGSWWQVYRDEYLCVHAQQTRAAAAEQQPSFSCSSINGSDSTTTTCAATAVVYLHTLMSPSSSSSSLSSCSQEAPPFSFLVTPSAECLTKDLIHNNLPLLSSSYDYNDNKNSNHHNNQKTTLEQLKCSFVLIIQGGGALSSGQPSLFRPPDIVTSEKEGPIPYYWTRPEIHDPYLLVRAISQSRALNRRLPSYFPLNCFVGHSSLSTIANLQDDENQNDNRKKNDNKNNLSLWTTENRLTTASRLVWGEVEEEIVKNVGGSKQGKATVAMSSPRRLLPSSCAAATTVSKDDLVLGEALSEAVADALERFLARPPSTATTTDSLVNDDDDDNNEIELDDDDDDDDDDDAEEDGDAPHRDNKADDELEAAGVHLLVLGTGCAAPSPYRGASGHVLLGNATVNDENDEPQASSSWAIAFEVGEGFVTQWNRYYNLPLSEREKATSSNIDVISVIWISHAHWDHYGGLAPLLLAIASSRQAKQESSHNSNNNKKSDTGLQSGLESSFSNKRARGYSNSLAPILFAPIQVLQFLHLLWPTAHHLYFHGVAHEDHLDCRASAWRSWNQRFATRTVNQPVVFWENILVDHSCRSSYGFVMGLRRQGGKEHGSTISCPESRQENVKPFIFAFSGDTRPCPSFVKACQRHGVVDFLVHEATFDEGERAMSIRKKHSTISEALQVADQVQARRALLTHFSQRYNNNDKLCQEILNKSDSRRSVAMALDGMLVPLWAC